MRSTEWIPIAEGLGQNTQRAAPTLTSIAPSQEAHDGDAGEGPWRSWTESARGKLMLNLAGPVTDNVDPEWRNGSKVWTTGKLPPERCAPTGYNPNGAAAYFGERW